MISEEQKSEFLREATNKIQAAIDNAGHEKSENAASIEDLRLQLSRPMGDTRRHILKQSLRQTEQRRNELDAITDSPFFSRCDVIFEGEAERKTVYFGKSSLIPESIFSWLAPAATIRFSDIGPVEYKLPDGTLKQGALLRKDNYLISKSQIRYFSLESREIPRQLIYQEFLSQRKGSFGLREIIEQLERAQDEVIRADWLGPYMIAGPAGSGKTTLALHRLAYLSQSPELSGKFPAEQCIVFVQNEHTRSYFESILPQLGIGGARVITFATWAMEILGISEIQHAWRYGRTEQERDHFELAKYRAIQKIGNEPILGAKDFWQTLEKIYQHVLSADLLTLFKKQKREKIIDRFDLTALLIVRKQTDGTIAMKMDEAIITPQNKVKHVMVKRDITYPLIILDEFANYMGEQLDLIADCSEQKTKAVLYIGDFAQQTLLCTSGSTNHITKKCPLERQIRLQHVYRNSREVLEYIQNIGYASVQIDERLKTGGKAEEYIDFDIETQIMNIKALAHANSDSIIGLLGRNHDLLKPFIKELSEITNIKLFTFFESQGVEFDIICLVNISEKNFGVLSQPLNDDPDASLHAPERIKVELDLLYVALTRAISEVHVFSNKSLKEIVALLKAKTTTGAV